MKLANKIMLITYPDSMGGDLNTLNLSLRQYFNGAVGGIHILPFFPSSGDRGFSPITYDQVAADFGNWEDIRKLSESYHLMCDVMVNHISKQSNEFRDYLLHGEKSEYAGMFLDYEEFWGKGRPTKEDIQLLYRRKDGEPYLEVEFSNGNKKKLWCTFTEEQLDLDINHALTKKNITETFHKLVQHGISLIRLDAVGYVIKRKNTNCFLVEPDIWEFMDSLNKSMKEKEIYLLPEIHDTWHTAKKLEAHNIWSYDFVLPCLMLQAIYKKTTGKLADWLRTAPKTQFTVLDTHDGIGVYDSFDWVNHEEAQELISLLEDTLSYSFKPLNPEKKRHWKAYQLYATYFSALHEDEQAYLCARAIQFFAPGIPQVYYVGMLAGKNDYDALAVNSDHRSINRHNFSIFEIEMNSQREVVKKLIHLMQFRNQYPAFDGEIIVENPTDKNLIITRNDGQYQAVLTCDFNTMDFNIKYRHEKIFQQLEL